MAYITALVIALTMAGQPAANALCSSWCDSPSDRHTCGEAIVNPATSPVSIASTACLTLTAATPFLGQEGRRILDAVSTGSGSAVSLPPHATAPPPCLLEGREPTAGRPLPVLVLRI